ncbi:MAG: DUF1292 domain-containing protein [Lachnospiraceae bacterium]
MEKIVFSFDDEEVEFFVLEQTRLGGVNYILVTDSADDEDGEALILKDISGEADTEAVYEIVENDEELEAVATVFENLIDDIELS